jgi:Sulfotransferase domain
LRAFFWQTESDFAKQAVTDAPCANLAQELVNAYPNAKVVLNTRDVDKWLPSMETSYYTILSWKSWQILSILEPVCPSLVLVFYKFLTHHSVQFMAFSFYFSLPKKKLMGL